MEISKKLLDDVARFIEMNRMIQENDGIAIGISGGADSMCLLHLLMRLQERYGLRLWAVHVNHMLRGDEADEDERFVADWCAANGIECFALREDVMGCAKQKKISVEEAGRELRYRQLENIRRQVGADKIAVAHNLNDQVETVLMRIFRGTGPDGLAGMSPVRGRIIRPLLGTSREDIEKYCLAVGIEARVDRTNLETEYTRNRVRLELIPYIRKYFNPDIEDAVSRMASLISEDRDFLQEEALMAFGECLVQESGRVTGQGDSFPVHLQGQRAFPPVQAGMYDNRKTVILDVLKLKTFHPALRKRVVRMAVEAVRGHLTGLQNINIENVLDLIATGSTGAEIHLPGGLRVRKSYDTVSIFPADSALSTEKDVYGSMNTPSDIHLNIPIPLNIPGETILERFKIKVVAEAADRANFRKTSAGSMVQYFDYNKVFQGINKLSARTRKDGDWFVPLGASGAKKLKDFFIDLKIPRDKRDIIPIIDSDKGIIWVVGCRIDDRFKVDGDTETLLKMEVKPL